eukprot:scaffold75294_cov54-Phaeocystis_antarctica.AAC.2
MSAVPGWSVEGGRVSDVGQAPERRAAASGLSLASTRQGLSLRARRALLGPKGGERPHGRLAASQALPHWPGVPRHAVRTARPRHSMAILTMAVLRCSYAASPPPPDGAGGRRPG